MTWIMFDNIILNPESGSNFCRLYADIRYYNPIGNEKLLESFRSEELALQRFEELKKMLIKEQETEVTSKFNPKNLGNYKNKKLGWEQL